MAFRTTTTKLLGFVRSQVPTPPQKKLHKNYAENFVNWTAFTSNKSRREPTRLGSLDRAIFNIRGLSLLKVQNSSVYRPHLTRYLTTLNLRVETKCLCNTAFTLRVLGALDKEEGLNVTTVSSSEPFQFY